jgi:hypothetical protein
MMHDKARDALVKKIGEAKTDQERDQLLATWYDWQFRATEWDADKWGLPSSRAMQDDLNCIRKRAEQDRTPVPEHWFAS